MLPAIRSVSVGLRITYHLGFVSRDLAGVSVVRAASNHSLDESADIAWALGSYELFLLLRTRRGWDADHYRQWLSRTLVEQLLLPDSRPRLLH